MEKKEFIDLHNKKCVNKDKVYALYNYLKTFAVGEKNMKSAQTIITAMPQFSDRRDLEHYIRVIRINFDRIVGSCNNGYWLACKSDNRNALAYSINQAKAKMEVAIREGVNPDLFFKLLNEIKDKRNDTCDNQLKLVETKNQRIDVKRYSDDLLDLEEVLI